MHIAVESQSLLQLRTGVEHYLYHLLEGFSKLDLDDTVSSFYFSAKGHKHLLPFASEKVKEQRLAFPPGRVISMMWKLFRYPHLESLLPNADLFHFPNYVIKPVGKKSKTVLTVHDLAFERMPETLEEKNLEFLRKFVPPSIERADKIIAVSEFTRSELIHYHPAAEGKTEVVYHGVDQEFARPINAEKMDSARKKYSLPQNYILAVGTIEPRKNIQGLLKACKILFDKQSDIDLVLCGSKGWKCDELVNEIMGGDLSKRIRWTGYVDQAELPALYSGARVFVYPSLYEGFGLPCLEAMAAGVPVVCSGTTSVPEVVGETAIKVEPENPESIAEGIHRVLSDQTLAVELVQQAKTRATQFTWQNTARQTLQIYKAIS